MKTRFLQNKILFAAMTGFFMLFAQTARSGEFVVLNRTYTYTYPEPANGGAFNCNTRDYSSMPSNWLSPDNYWNGHFYGYFELIDIPTNYTVGFQLGIYQYYLYNGKDYYETCSYTQAQLQGKGNVVQIDYGSPSAWWQHPNGGVDFTKPNEFEEVGLAIWSHEPGHTGIICPTASGGDDIANAVRADFEPCTIRAIIVAVSAGSSFSGWSNYLGGGCTPTQQPIPTYGIDFAAEKTNKVVPSTDEYSIYSNMSGALSGTGSYLSLTPGQNVYFRTKASGSCYLASNVQTLVVPAKPSKPSYTIDYSNEKTAENVNSTIEYSTSSSYANPVSGNGIPVSVTPGGDLYFWVKATSSSFYSDVFHLAIPSHPAAPSAISIDYINERTTQSIASNMEYSTSASFASSTSGAGSAIAVTPGQDLYIRYKTTASAFASSAYLLDVPARPAAPAVTIDYTQEKTVEAIPSTVEYSTSASMSDAVSGSGTTLVLTPGTDLYLRVKATASSFISANAHLSVPASPAAPSITVDFSNEKTTGNITSSMEYSTSASFTGSASGVGNSITVTPGQNLYIRTKATDSTFVSSIFLLNVPARPAAPTMTIDYAHETTAESVPSTIEYSLNETMTSPFSGINAALALTPGSNLYLKVKASESSFVSEIQHLIIPSRPAAPSITIDYINEKTLESVGSTIEYSINEDFTSLSFGSGSPVHLFPGIHLYFRVSYTASSFCSSGFLLEVPHRPSLEYTGADTITAALFAVKAILDESMTGLELSDLSVTNGAAQNLRGDNSFDVIPASKGNVAVSILPNSFDNGGFGSGVLTVYYGNAVNAIPQTDDNRFILYPVPSKNGIITINSRQSIPYAIGIYSFDGRFVRSFKVNAALSCQIDLQDLPKGIYFLKVNANDRVSVHKVILE